MGNARTRRAVWLLSVVAVGCVPPVALLAAAYYCAAVQDAVARVVPKLSGILLGAGLAALAVCWARGRGRSRKDNAESATEGGLPRSCLWTLALSGAFVVFLSPILLAWTTHSGGSMCELGLFPASDAGGYYTGAERLMAGEKLDAWNSRRPFHTLVTAVRLALAGNNLRGMLVLQAASLALGCLLLARAVAIDFGWAAGFLMFAGLYAVGRENVHVPMTENTGLALAALACATLWHGVRSGQRAMVATGVFLLTVALNTRSGAFFTLPALAVWAGFAYRSGARFHWRFAGVCAAAVVAAFLFNSLLLGFYGAGFGVGHGNLAHTLYGLSTGHPGWSRIYDDFPQTAKLGETAQNAFIYSKTWEAFRRNPLNLPLGVARRFLNFSWECPLTFAAALSLQLGERAVLKALGVAYLLLAGLGALWFLWRNRRRAEASLMVAALVGFALSAAIIWGDGGLRIFVATLPFPVLLVVLGLFAWRDPERVWRARSASHRFGQAAWLPVALAAIHLAAALFGPALVRAGHRAVLPPYPPSATGGKSFVIRTGPGIASLDVVPSDAKARTLFQIRRDELERLCGAPGEFRSVGARTPMTLLGSYDLQTLSPGAHPVLVVAPRAMAGPKPGYARIAGSFRESPSGLPIFLVSSFAPVE